MDTHKFSFSAKMKSKLSVLLCFTLIFAMVSSLFANTAEAKSVRIAIIEKVTGTVTVKKAGGSKSFRAFATMSLNQGDHVVTEAKSSVILKVIDHDDEVTVGENSSIYLSKLNEKGGNKKTGVKMWAGSIWVKAKTLVNSDDEFEVETPTAVMGIRGTQFFSGVDAETGDTKVIVVAGEVKAELVNTSLSKDNTTNNGTPSDTNTENIVLTILPSQEANINSTGDDSQPTGSVSALDVDKFIASSSSEIIEAIIRNKDASDKENEEYIKKKQADIEAGTTQPSDGSTLELNNLDDLARVTKNLDNLIGNIVKAAIETKKVDETEIKKIIEEANKQSDKKLDLDKIQELEITEKEKAKQAEIALLDKLKKEKQEELKKLEEEKAKKFAELLKNLEEEKKKIEESNKLAQEKAKKEAEEKYKAKLDAEKLAEFEKQKQALPTPTPAATPTPTPSPTPSPPPAIVTPPPLSSAATITSAMGIVSTGATANETITGVPFCTTLQGFKAGITAAAGAAFQLYLSDGITWATDLQSGYKVIVTAANGNKVTYNVTVESDPGSISNLCSYTKTGLWNVIGNNSGIKNQAVVSGISSLPAGDESGGLLPNSPFGGLNGRSLWYGRSISDTLNDNAIGNFLYSTSSAVLNTGGNSDSTHSGTAISPSFVVPSYTDGITPFLNFWSWFEIESVSPTYYDIMRINVIDNGVKTQLAILNPTSSTNSSATSSVSIPYTSAGYNLPAVWKVYVNSLAKYSGKTIQIQFEFDTRDASYNGFRGWFIDNISLIGRTMTSVEAIAEINSALAPLILPSPGPSNWAGVKESTFTIAGVTGVTNENFIAVKAALEVDYVSNSGNFTQAHIQSIVNTLNGIADINNKIALGNAADTLAALKAAAVGITGIIDANANAYQTALSSAKTTKGSVLTKAEIQTKVIEVNAATALSNIKGYAANSNASALTIGELITAGVTGTIDGNIAAYQTAVAAAGNTIVDLAALQTLVNQVNNVELAFSALTNESLTTPDATAATPAINVPLDGNVTYTIKSAVYSDGVIPSPGISIAETLKSVSMTRDLVITKLVRIELQITSGSVRKIQSYEITLPINSSPLVSNPISIAKSTVLN